ncbi:apolipoprotein N-acyltransferase, partial [Streptomyces sp. WAC07061]
MSSSVTRAAESEPSQPAGRTAAVAPSEAAAEAGASPRREEHKAAWLVRSALAGAAGVLLYLSFPPRPLWWL